MAANGERPANGAGARGSSTDGNAADPQRRTAEDGRSRQPGERRQRLGTALAWGIIVAGAAVTAVLWLPRITGSADGLATPSPAAPGPTSEPTPAASATATAEPTPERTGAAPSRPAFDPDQPPSPGPTEDGDGQASQAALQEARASDAWPALAEWDRIEPRDHNIRWYLGGTGRGVIVAAFKEPGRLWDEVMPGLRDQLLRDWIRGEIEPVDRRFIGTPFEDEYESGVIGWWTNAGSGGRGYMSIAYGAYRTADGEDRMRVWPIMIDPGFMPQGFVDAVITSVGPPVELDYDDFETSEEANQLLNEGWDDWFQAQPVRYDAVNPPEDDPMQGGS